MWLPLSMIALCILFDSFNSTKIDNDLELIFTQRTHSDWRNAWHKEKYARCRESLIQHLYWACEKDIYRINRRTDPKYEEQNDDNEVYSFPYVSKANVKTMLRYRRRKRSTPSITNECCKSATGGCTWEEYAEYCPTNKRQNAFITNYD